MQTSSSSASPNWTDMAGAETIAKVEAAIKADPTFLAEAQADLNGAVERRMGISFPIPLKLHMKGDIGQIWSQDEFELASTSEVREVSASGELSDADLDLVSGGSSVKTCAIAQGNFDT